MLNIISKEKISDFMGLVEFDGCGMFKIVGIIDDNFIICF